MWPYWLMFAVPALAAVTDRSRTRPGLAVPKASGIALALAAIACALVVGLRFEVGGDWFNYYENLDRLRGTELMDVLSMPDPGFQLVGWLSLKLDWGIYGVNFICGVLFATGLFAFSHSLARPWLAIAVAVPYLVVVVAMGYTRQGVALGFAMLGFTLLRKGSVLWCVVLLLMGATFHKSEVLLIPLVGLVTSRNRYWTLLWVSAASFLAYDLLLADTVDDLYTNYVEAEYQSQGALIRLWMNAVPAGIFLALRKRFRFSPVEARLWLLFSLISLVLLVVLFFTDATTAVDRVGLYMLPLQLAVFAQLPGVLGPPNRRNTQWAALVLLYYAAVLFVWLNFATHAEFWLPYRFYPLEASA